MALKTLLSTSSLCIRLLKGDGRIYFQKLEFGNLIRRWFFSPQIRDYGVGAESENGVSTGMEAAGVSKQPIVRETLTHEDCLREFLLKKGASDETIDSIISRYPRAVTRTSENLWARWNIWKSVLKTDLQVLQTLDRSPESFFRSSDIDNLKKNITFLSTLGLSPKVITQLMAKAPRTFSNRTTLNQDMVEFLQNLCICLGGDNPTEFARKIITKNLYLLTRSTKRIKANIETIQSMLKIPNEMMLDWIQGNGSDILDLGNAYLKKNFENIQEKLQPLGCSEEEIIAYIFKFPQLLYLSPVTFNNKVDLLLECGVKVYQILASPRVMDVSADTMQRRIKELTPYDYDFQALGIGILVLSSSRFKAKFQKIINSKT